MGQTTRTLWREEVRIEYEEGDHLPARCFQERNVICDPQILPSEPHERSPAFHGFALTTPTFHSPSSLL